MKQQQHQPSNCDVLLCENDLYCCLVNLRAEFVTTHTSLPFSSSKMLCDYVWV
jgi:hypothetical protein